MRAFLALPLPGDFALALAEACSALRDAPLPDVPPRGSRRGWRFIRPADMHLTLAFLGDLDKRGVEGARLAALRAIRRVWRDADGTASGIAVRARGLVAFPPRGPASVIAARLCDGASRIASLADGIELELERVGAETGVRFRPRERRPFLPHITLARAGRPGIRVSARELDIPVDSSCRVDAVVLYRSVLEPAGPRYEALDRMLLA